MAFEMEPDQNVSAGKGWHPNKEIEAKLFEYCKTTRSMYRLGHLVGVNPEVLKNHYKKVIDRAKAIAADEVARPIYEQAVKGDIRAGKIWLEAMAPEEGWGQQQQQAQESTVESVRAAVDKLLKDDAKKYVKDF